MKIIFQFHGSITQNIFKIKFSNFSLSIYFILKMILNFYVTLFIIIKKYTNNNSHEIKYPLNSIKCNKNS